MIATKLFTFTWNQYGWSLMATKMASNDPRESAVLTGAGFDPSANVITLAVVQVGSIEGAYDPYHWTTRVIHSPIIGEIMKLLHQYIAQHYDILPSGAHITLQDDAAIFTWGIEEICAM